MAFLRVEGWVPRRKQNLGVPPGLVEGDDLSTEGSDRAWVYEIYLELRQQILENRLSLRPRFTSTDLKSLYPSSSTSAGVVLQWLAAEGYLVFHEPFSYEVKHWPPEEIQDRYRIRIPIEAAAAFDAAERIGSRHLLALKAAHVAATRALRARPVDGETLIVAARDFHLRVLASTGNTGLVDSWEIGFVPALHRLACRAMSCQDMAFVHHLHEAIIHAFEARDAWLARSLVESLLRQYLRVLLDDATGAVLPPADRRWRSDFTEEPVLIDFGKGTLDAFGSVSSRVIKAARKRYWFDNPPDAWR